VHLIEQLHFADTKTDTKGARTGWRVFAYVRICWLDFDFAVANVSLIAATINVLAAQRFGEEFGVSDSVETCPIPTLASKFQRFALKTLGGFARRLSAKTSAKLLTLRRHPHEHRAGTLTAP